jgi:hypothetical protein
MLFGIRLGQETSTQTCSFVNGAQTTVFSLCNSPCNYAANGSSFLCCAVVFGCFGLIKENVPMYFFSHNSRRVGVNFRALRSNAVRLHGVFGSFLDLEVF